MHNSTFQYLKPLDPQLQQMEAARNAVHSYEVALQSLVPEGPDKTYLLRKLREVAMWVNVAITRNPDGSPRT